MIYDNLNIEISDCVVTLPAVTVCDTCSTNLMLKRFMFLNKILNNVPSSLTVD